MKDEHSIQVELIKDLLRKGLERKEILQEFTRIYKTGVKTFDNRLKVAREGIKDEAKRINDKTNDIVEAKAKENALKTISVAERIDILAKIATEKENNPSEKIKAIAELNKMDGSYAPIQTQTDLTLNGNGDLPIDKWLKDAESK